MTIEWNHFRNCLERVTNGAYGVGGVGRRHGLGGRGAGVAGATLGADGGGHLLVLGVRRVGHVEQGLDHLRREHGVALPQVQHPDHFALQITPSNMKLIQKPLHEKNLIST